MVVVLLPEKWVPGYPFKYLMGTRVQKYPKVRALIISLPSVIWYCVLVISKGIWLITKYCTLVISEAFMYIDYRKC